MIENAVASTLMRFPVSELNALRKVRKPPITMPFRYKQTSFQRVPAQASLSLSRVPVLFFTFSFLFACIVTVDTPAGALSFPPPAAAVGEGTDRLPFVSEFLFFVIFSFLCRRMFHVPRFAPSLSESELMSIRLMYVLY